MAILESEMDLSTAATGHLGASSLPPPLELPPIRSPHSLCCPICFSTLSFPLNPGRIRPVPHLKSTSKLPLPHRSSHAITSADPAPHASDARCHPMRVRVPRLPPPVSPQSRNRALTGSDPTPRSPSSMAPRLSSPPSMAPSSHLQLFRSIHDPIDALSVFNSIANQPRGVHTTESFNYMLEQLCIHGKIAEMAKALFHLRSRQSHRSNPQPPLRLLLSLRSARLRCLLAPSPRAPKSDQEEKPESASLPPKIRLVHTVQPEEPNSDLRPDSLTHLHNLSKQEPHPNSILN